MLNSLNRSACALFLFILLAVLGQHFHELWHDEARAWIIAQDFSWFDIPAMVKFEVHTPIWYYLIKLTNTPQLLSLVFGCVGFYLVICYSPFTGLQRLLLALNCYFLYQFTIISRNYSLEICTLMGLCALFPLPFKRTRLFYALLIILLGTSQVFGLVFASALLITLSFISWKQKDLKEDIVAFICIGLVLCAILWFITPPANSIASAGMMSLQDLPVKILQTLSYVLISLFTIPLSPFMSSNLTQSVLILVCYSLVIIAVISLFIRRYKSSPVTLLFFLVSFTGILAINIFNKTLGFNLNYLGQVTLCLIASEWIFNGKASRLFTVILSFQAIFGILLFSADVMRPYSQGEEVARFLKQQGPFRLVPDHPLTASSYLIYLDQKFWSDSHQKDVRVLEYIARQFPGDEKNQSGLHPSTVGSLKLRLAHEVCMGSKTILVTNYEMPSESTSALCLQSLATFTGALFPIENFYVHQVNSECAVNSGFCAK